MESSVHRGRRKTTGSNSPSACFVELFDRPAVINRCTRPGAVAFAESAASPPPAIRAGLLEQSECAGRVFRNAASREIQRPEQKATLAVPSIAGLLKILPIAFACHAQHTATAVRQSQLASMREAFARPCRVARERPALVRAIPSVMHAVPEPCEHVTFIIRTQVWHALPRPFAHALRQNSGSAPGLCAPKKPVVYMTANKHTQTPI